VPFEVHPVIGQVPAAVSAVFESGDAPVRINWGDGTIETFDPADFLSQHVYAADGVYTISVREIGTSLTEKIRVFLDQSNPLGAVRTGANQDDLMAGGSGGDQFETRGGDDYVSAGGGDDTILGGAGEDIMNGGDGADKILGGAGNDRLNGDQGDDTLNGGAGGDVLEGGAGDDLMHGSNDGEMDVFLFQYWKGYPFEIADLGFDTIVGFVPGEDIISLDFIPQGGSDVHFVASSDPAAGGSGTWLLYDTDNGTLSYDLDGTGGDQEVALFRLKGAPALSISDFFFIS
jgi:Ca2+-binding RTX toxin-like protein